MWTIQPSAEYERRQKRFEKKRPNELRAVLDNLDTMIMGLKDGLKLEQVSSFGFVHHEPLGVLAIDQEGGHGAKLAQTRLYVYPDTGEKVTHVITLGDKGTQADDIEFAKQFVQSIRKALQEAPHGPEKTLR
jgi:hypothetical protein